MIKNFLFLLKRFKTSSVLNILGLSVAFAAFIAIMIQVSFEYNYDSCHPNAKRIYRVDMLISGGSNQILPRAFADAVIASSPHIKEATIVTPIDEWGEAYMFRQETKQMKKDLWSHLKVVMRALQRFSDLRLWKATRIV